MMGAQLDDCRARGEPVAYLWASEERIYGHFGYGLASLTGEVDVPREGATFRAPVPPCGRPRLVPLPSAAPLVTPIWERVARVTPGMFVRAHPRLVAGADPRRSGRPGRQRRWG